MKRHTLFAVQISTAMLLLTTAAPARAAPDECEVLIYGPNGAPLNDASTPMTPVPPGSTPGTPGAPDTPGATPTPSPTPTPTPTNPGSGGGGNGGYVTKPSPPRVVTKNVSGTKVTYHVGQYTPGYSHQNLSEVKSYPSPSGGTVRTVAGQKILVSGSHVKTSNLSKRMTDIIDELNITAKLIGLPSPVITSATDGSHSTTSLHGNGHALDLRCRERSLCIKWVGVLKQALGPGYDVMYEDWGSANSHIHLEYDGKS